MKSFTILFIADICGKAGRQAAAHLTKPLKEKYEADYVIANVENAAGGFGVTTEMSRKIFSYGVDMQTSGNHIWDRMDIIRYLDTRPRLLRPANYPANAPGSGSFIDTVNDTKIGILNLQGRTYMKDIDCPFKIADRELEAIRKQSRRRIIHPHRFPAVHLGPHGVEVDEPALEDRPCHPLQRFVHLPVQLNLVVQRAENAGDGVLSRLRGNRNFNSLKVFLRHMPQARCLFVSCNSDEVRLQIFEQVEEERG